MKQLRQTLYIMTPERYLSLDGENVVVQEKKTVLARLPLHNVDGKMCRNGLTDFVFESFGEVPLSNGRNDQRKCIAASAAISTG